MQHVNIWSSADISSSFQESNTIDLSEKAFDDNSFNEFIENVRIKKPGIVILSNERITEQQKHRLLTVINSNSHKATILHNADGSRFGPVYTDWSEYFAAKSSVPYLQMRETTQKALMAIRKSTNSSPKQVIDFGAGTGQDTIPLITQHKIKVIAIDSDKRALDTLRANIPECDSHLLTCISQPFISYEPVEKVDLLIANFTWPYRPPEDFPACWQHSLSVLRPRGYIAGTFFGPKDKPDAGMTYHTQVQLCRLIYDKLDIIWLEREDKGSREIYGGEEPAWGDYLFHLVAQLRE